MTNNHKQRGVWEDAATADTRGFELARVRGNPKYEDIFFLMGCHKYYWKSETMLPCPRCKSDLEYIGGYIRKRALVIIQCSKDTCIGIELKHIAGAFNLPRFIERNYALFAGEDYVNDTKYNWDEKFAIVIGEEPGYSKYVGLKPNAPKWAVDEYKTLKDFYDGVIDSCVDLNGNKYGVVDNQRISLPAEQR